MCMQKLDDIICPLLEWFSANARKLPWRMTWNESRKIPSELRSYQVWVSEIMLQQTRVEAVKPFYLRFMNALPDITALADCPEDRLLKLWEGLGYYSRVKNMQKAARIVVDRYSGKMPDSCMHLQELPGIGSYTAGAISSIVYGQQEPAVDGNVLRVLSRVCGSDADITRQSVKKLYEQEIRSAMKRKLDPEHAEEQAGALNQALMELGAVVCVPNGVPCCSECPIAEQCIAFEKGIQQQLPVKKTKKKRKTEARTVLVIRDSEHAAIRKRPDNGLLAGLYELPNMEGHLDADEVLEIVRGWGFSPIRVTRLPAAKHIFSHVEWQMTGYQILVEDIESFPEEDRLAQGILFVEPHQTEEEYSIPAAFAAYVRHLSIRLGQEKYRETEE